MNKSFFSILLACSTITAMESQYAPDRSPCEQEGAVMSGNQLLDILVSEEELTRFVKNILENPPDTIEKSHNTYHPENPTPNTKLGSNKNKKKAPNEETSIFYSAHCPQCSQTFTGEDHRVFIRKLKSHMRVKHSAYTEITYEQCQTKKNR